MPRLTSYYLDGESERSRGGTTTVNRFDVDTTDGGSSAASGSSVTSNSAGNSNSSLSVADEGSSFKGRKKIVPQSVDTLSFEELGKVYTNISKREVVSKVKSQSIAAYKPWSQRRNPLMGI